jgi:hypothetical protein
MTAAIPTVAEAYEVIVARARAAGREAGLKCRPTPMVVFTPVGILAGKGGEVVDLTKPVYFVDDGACGFAWIQFPANTAFGRWAKKAGIATKAYPTGLWIWVNEFGQSVERKEAYASAFARVLQSHGIDCYAGSRLD